MRNRHRGLYQMTGLPGWMRYGFSPGWMARGMGPFGPCAHYLMYGAWPTPQMHAAWQSGQTPYSPLPGFLSPYDPWGAAELTREQEIDWLKQEADEMRDELAWIEKRIHELEGELS